MIVSINQPAYLPWLGYLQRIASSDVHIVLDHVQFEKNSFTNRNQIKTPQGSAWLTVPVLTKGHFGNLSINKLEIDNRTNWRRKHWQSLRMNYAKAPFFEEHAAFFEAVYKREWILLEELCAEITTYLMSAFGIVTTMIPSSGMDHEGVKSELIYNLCCGQGATTYLSGALGRDYLDEQPFEDAGIKVIYQDYGHPVYPQVHGDFVPNLAAVDLLFNCGPRALEIMTNGKELG